MKKSILFSLLFFTLESMESNKSLESAIKGKKKWTLNPLKNISEQKKFIYIANFQKIIEAFLNDIAERLGRIRDINIAGIEEYTERLKRSQNNLLHKEVNLKKLQANLELHKYNEFKLIINKPKKLCVKKVCTMLDVCLNLVLKQKLKSEFLELIDVETTVLKLIAYLYSELKDVEPLIDKQETFYQKYITCCKDHQKKISILFLEKAEKNSRWLLLRKLKELGDVADKPSKSKRKIKKESYPFNKKPKIEFSFYFKKIDSLMRKRKKFIYISNVQKQTKYWLSKALDVDSEITINERSKQIYSQIIDRLNHVPGNHNIFSATRKERQASKLYHTYEYRTPGSLEALQQEQPSLIEKFDRSKESLKEEMINLLTIAETEIENEDFAQAEIHINKARELGGTNSLIHHMIGRLEKSGYTISLDYEQLCQKTRRLSTSLHSSVRKKRKKRQDIQKKEYQEEKSDKEEKKDKGKEKVEGGKDQLG